MRRSILNRRIASVGLTALALTALLATRPVGLGAQSASGQNREPYSENFENGSGGWLANRYEPLPILDGAATCYSPWYLDSHHAPPGAGYIHMLMYLYTRGDLVGADRKAHLQGNGFIEQNKSTDLTNARLSVRLRGDVDLQGSDLVLLIQGKTPKTMANFVLSGQPLRVGHDWTEQSIVLSPDPKQWTCLGARWDKVDQYGCDDIAVLLKDVNFDIMFVLFPLKVVPTHPELVKDMHRMRPGQDYPGYPSYEVEQKYLPRGVIMFDSVRIDYPDAAAQANPADDATLRALSASPGKLSPGFSSPRKLYTVFVSQTCENIRVTAAAGNPLAAIRINGARTADGAESAPIPVSVGRNLVDIAVIAADGKVQGKLPDPRHAPLSDAELGSGQEGQPLGAARFDGGAGFQRPDMDLRRVHARPGQRRLELGRRSRVDKERRDPVRRRDQCPGEFRLRREDVGERQRRVVLFFR